MAAPIPLQDLCPIFTSDLCTYLMQCADAPYRDIDHCKAEVDCYGLPDLTASAAKGSVLYDPSKVGACHERFIADPCHFGFFFSTPDIYEVLSFCPGTVTPQVALGGACVSTGECEEGYCLKSTGTCPGTCTAPSGVGEPCGAECATGLRCDANNVCQLEGKAGDPCQSLEDCGAGDYCVASPGCTNQNLFCDLTTNMCKAGVGEGEACGAPVGGSVADQIHCSADLWCDAVFLDKSGVCRKVGGAGSPCTDAVDCTGGLHCIGYVPLATAGSPAALGTCGPPSASGGACTFDDDCQPGLRCTAQFCAALGASGETCTQSTECQSGLVCWNNQCIAPKYPGDPCVASTDCVLGLCKGGTCVDHAKVGAACTVGTDCTTGVCTQGACVDTSVCPN